MKRKISIPLGLWSFLLLVLFYPCLCSAGDRILVPPVLISPLPGTLAGLPMEISFNGRAGLSPQTPRSDLGVSDRGAEGKGADASVSPSGTQRRPFARLQAYMLKYVTIGTAASGQDMFDASVTGIEGSSPGKISFEVQAGLADLSGALFIVFQL